MREQLNHFLDTLDTRQMAKVLSWVIGAALAVRRHMTRAALFILFSIAAGPGVASTQETATKLTLPSGVKITIIEGRVIGSKLPNCRVNGKSVTLGEHRPATYVKHMYGEFNGKRFTLDASCMTDAWNGRPLEVPGTIRYFGGKCSNYKSGLSCTLRGVFADASETFVAEWIVVAGNSTRTVLSNSQDVISLFMKNIDPQ